MSSEIQTQILEAVKDAMRAREKERLAALRLITAEFKRIEVDERIELDDARVLAVLDKMIKQRKDSAQQYTQHGRQELADKELFEISVIQTYLPCALDADAVRELVVESAAAAGATTIADMGKLMAFLKPKVQGRADMGLVSQLVKAHLSN